MHKLMEFGILVAPIIGGVLLGGFAAAALFSGYKILGLWLAFAGIICFLLVVVLQIQNAIQNSGTGQLNPDRPYVAVAAIGFPNMLIIPGPIVVKWDIKNSGRTLRQKSLKPT